jgi:hydroxymethylpyrimidine pyrophosphatase-like HAD family hydrolase
VKLRVLALNLDGAIATDGRLDGGVADAIREVRRAGVMTVLVSGRVLADIHALLPAPDLFDGVVAEGGAVMQIPNGPGPTVLARGPDPALIAELRRRNVAHRSGLCMVEADAVAAPDVLASLHALGAPHGISFDRRRMRVLPDGVSKATGLSETVWRLGASLHNTVAIGDADDDRPMLDVCEIGAAVAWGSSALQRSADHVIAGSGPPALADYVRTLVATDPTVPRRKSDSPHRLRVGMRETGEPVDVDIRYQNVLFTGDPQSGKTWLVSLLCERLILKRYAICILDPEGDYAGLGALPGVIVHRVHRNQDLLPGLEPILRQPALSVVVDISGLAVDAKPAAVRSLLRGVDAIRRARGIPHLIVLDEAHYFLHRHADANVFDPKLGGCYLVTYRSTDLPPGLIDACDFIVATRIADRRFAARLLGLTRPGESSSEGVDALANLAIGEAVLLRASPEHAHGIIRFALEGRVTTHVRHRNKYVDVGVPPGREFVFTRDGRSTERRVRTLRELVEALPAVPADVFAGHLVRGDFHRWIEDVVADRALADAIRSIELGNAGDARETMMYAIRARYLDGDSEPCDGGRPDTRSAGAAS